MFPDMRTRAGKFINKLREEEYVRLTELAEQQYNMSDDGTVQVDFNYYRTLHLEAQQRMEPLEYAANYAQENSKGKSLKHWNEQYEIGLMLFKMGVDE